MDRNMFVLNTSILTSYGRYRYEKIDIEEARRLLSQSFVSAVGHEGTAQFLSMLTGIKIPVNRIGIQMSVGDEAVVFKLLTRLPEGKVLTIEELETIPYEIGLLTKESE